MDDQNPEKTKRRAFSVLKLKSSKFLTETDKRAYATANVKLTIPCKLSKARSLILRSEIIGIVI